MRILCVLVLSGVVVGAPLLARAQESAAAGSPGAGARDDEGRRAFELGRDAYGEARYLDAVTHWERAFALARRPMLLLNLARAYELLGEPLRAARSLEEYLVYEPEDPSRPALERRIALLGDPARPGDGDGGLWLGRTYAWVVVAIGLGLGLAGLGLYLDADSTYAELEAECGGTAAGCPEAAIGALERDVTVVHVALAASLAAVAGAAVLFAVEGPSEPDGDPTVFVGVRGHL